MDGGALQSNGQLIPEPSFVSHIVVCCVVVGVLGEDVVAVGAAVREEALNLSNLSS